LRALHEFEIDSGLECFGLRESEAGPELSVRHFPEGIGPLVELFLQQLQLIGISVDPGLARGQTAPPDFVKRLWLPPPTASGWDQGAPLQRVPSTRVHQRAQRVVEDRMRGAALAARLVLVLRSAHDGHGGDKQFETRGVRCSRRRRSPPRRPPHSPLLEGGKHAATGDQLESQLGHLKEKPDRVVHADAGRISPRQGQKQIERVLGGKRSRRYAPGRHSGQRRALNRLVSKQVRGHPGRVSRRGQQDIELDVLDWDRLQSDELVHDLKQL